MIIISSPRQDIETIVKQFFPMINLWKDTRMKNVAHLDRLSQDYFTALIYNSILTEVELLFNKHYHSTTSKSIRIKFNLCQAAVFYRELIIIQIDSDHVYQIFCEING